MGDWTAVARREVSTFGGQHYLSLLVAPAFSHSYVRSFVLLDYFPEGADSRGRA